MNMVSKKIVAIIAVAAVAIVLVLGVGLKQPATTSGTSTQPAAGAGAVTPDEASVLSTQTDAVLAEQVMAVPDSSSDFAASAQDSMASDSSQFLYQ